MTRGGGVRNIHRSQSAFNLTMVGSYEKNDEVTTFTLALTSFVSLYISHFHFPLSVYLSISISHALHLPIGRAPQSTPKRSATEWGRSGAEQGGEGWRWVGNCLELLIGMKRKGLERNGAKGGWWMRCYRSDK